MTTADAGAHVQTLLSRLMPTARLWTYIVQRAIRACPLTGGDLIEDVVRCSDEKVRRCVAVGAGRRVSGEGEW